MVALVAKSEIVNFNFSMPKEISDEYRRLGDGFGEKNKLRWAIAGAALLKFLEVPEEEMKSLIQRVMGLREYPKDLTQAIEEAKAKATTFKGGADAEPVDDDKNINEGKPSRRGRR